MTRALFLLCMLASCGRSYDPKYDAAVQCPRAAKLGITGPGLIACDELAVLDRRNEFLKTHQITATCTGSAGYLDCSGMSKTGVPVKFKCDGRRCEWIPAWLW